MFWKMHCAVTDVHCILWLSVYMVYHTRCYRMYRLRKRL